MKKISIKEIEQTREALELSIARMIDHYESIVPMRVEEIEILEDEETGKNVIYIKDMLGSNSKIYLK